MRVLWFTNTPSLAAGHLNLPSFGGGWIESLEEKMRLVDNIDLAVAFGHGKTRLEKFSKHNTTYYAIPDRSSRIKKMVGRHLNVVSNDELIDYCLKIVDDFKPDIVNIFGTEKAFGLIGNKIKTPVVIHLQGLLTVYEKKWFSSGIRKKDLIAHSGIKRLLRTNSLIHSYYFFRSAAKREQEIFRIGKYFLGRTDWDKRITAVLAPDARYYTSNEILKGDFYVNEWHKNSQQLKVFISTIQPNIYKGLETVLECAVLLKKLNKFSFTWFIAGILGSDPMVKLFEGKIGKQFADFNIRFCGSLVAPELVRYELDADIFIHPSHIDNSPNSVCEAMLLGMPVIATNTGGTASLLADKKEGILIQDGDPFAMAGAILELTENPVYAAELGKNARILAMKRHDPDKIVTNLIGIYTEIVSAQNNKTGL
jgi:glycosyltransferase involved in cell wall biosynthesis